MRPFGHLRGQLSGLVMGLKLMIDVDCRLWDCKWRACGSGAAAGQCGDHGRISDCVK